MSQWKKLLGDKSKDSQSFYSLRPERYTPKKRAYDEQSPSRFHNQTLQKINMSGLSEEKEKSLGRSFVGKVNEPETDMKNMKASSSQVRLHKDSLLSQDKKNVILSMESLGQNQFDRKSSQLKKSAFVGKMERSALYEEVQKIKKEFGIFQSIILKELQRQQRLINNMFQQIITKLKEQNENTQRNYDLLANLKTKNQPEEHKINECYKAYSQVIDSKPSHFDRVVAINQPQYEASLHNQSCDKNTYPFQRFFEAMENLKRNFNELNLISDISSVGSPKSYDKPISFDQMQTKFRTHLK